MYLEAGNIREAQVEDDAVERVLFNSTEGFRARCRRLDIDVVVIEKGADTELFGGVVFDHQQRRFRLGAAYSLMRTEGRDLQSFLRRQALVTKEKRTAALNRALDDPRRRLASAPECAA